jgi:hypothetical protein
MPISTHTLPRHTFLGEEYVAVANGVDPNGLHLIHKNPEKNWIGGAEVLRGQGRSLSWDTAMRMFIAQYEFLAYARAIYGYGGVAWAELDEARADAECATILLGGYIHLMDYGGNCVELAIAEMKRSPRRWLPVFALCLEQSDYTRLALPTEEGTTTREPHATAVPVSGKEGYPYVSTDGTH